MLKLALAFALCASSALPSIRYTFYNTWIGKLDGDLGPKLQSMGFTFNSPTFFTGGILTAAQVTNCRGWPFDYYSQCGGGALFQTAEGVVAYQLLLDRTGPVGYPWILEGNTLGAGVFPGVRLDEFGAWSMSMAGPPGAMATLTIMNDDSPEPGAAGLALCGIGFLVLVSALKNRKSLPAVVGT
jgi:hypothetical protein